MWISKKKVLSLLKENYKDIEEMAMDFDTQDRPHNDIQRDLGRGDTPYKNTPLLDTDNPNQNFQELLASKRYRQVVANLRQYVGNIPTLQGDNQLFPLANIMQGALTNIVNTERAHRHELEQLAINLVTKELTIPEGAIVLNAKIIGVGDVNNENFDYKGDDEADEEAERQAQNQGDDEEMGDEEPGGDGMGGEEEDDFNQIPEQQIEVEEDLFNHLNTLDLERAKRRFVNGLIQGASERGHYMYHYVADEIRRITGSDEIIRQYGIMMSINDTLYWQMGSEMMKAAMGTPPEPPQQGGQQQGGQQQRRGERPGVNSTMAGRVDVDRNQEVPVVNAVGVNFPVVVHELIKGVYEIFSLQGQPKDPNIATQVLSTEDTLAKENWDIRLGPSIWDMLREKFPEQIKVDENLFEMQNYLFNEVIKLPPKQFFTLMREIMMNTPRASVMMDNLLDGIYKMWEGEDYNEETELFHDDVEQATNDISDEDLNAFLKSIGVKIQLDSDFDANKLDDLSKN